MSLKDVKVGFALTGSFCTLDIVFKQMRRLVDMGAEVYPITSYNVINNDTRFGKAEDFLARAEEICGRPVMKSKEAAEPIGPKKRLDVVVIAPCTGNTLAKLANAVTDTPALMAAKAHMRNNGKVVLAMATNDGLGLNAQTIGKLMAVKNTYFVRFGQDGPESKEKSFQSRFALIPETIEAALQRRQLQPALLGAKECLTD